MTNVKADPKTHEWKNLIAEFQHTSDRAVVVIGTTYLQNQLGRILQCFFVDDEDLVSQLLAPEKSLGELGARIRTTYALGLISSNEYYDLIKILEIRDAFFADLSSTRFTSEDIRNDCYLLKLPREVLLPEETPTPRRIFVFAIALLVGQLTLRADQAERERRTPPESFMLIDVER